MKIEKITPQIAALYLGAKCDLEWMYTDTVEDSFQKGDVWQDSKIGVAHVSRIEHGEISITPHLRRLESITEEEAREVYEVKYCTPCQFSDDYSAIDMFWEREVGNYDEQGSILIGTPAVWLYLLSKGFDLFGLIESGLAKEIKPETVNQ